MPSPTKGKPSRRAEVFDCRTHCMRRGQYDDRCRAERGCTRIDMHPIPGPIRPETIVRRYQGRAPLAEHVRTIGGRTINPNMPMEDPDDGCPGGWYRCRFIWSLQNFIRSRTETGDRVTNPFFDNCADEIVWQWVLYFEHEQERHEVHCAEEIVGRG